MLFHKQHLLRSRQAHSAGSSPTGSSLVQHPRRMQPVAPASAAAEAPELQQVQKQVAEWLRLDTDAASRAQVQSMLDGQAHAALKELMCQRLEFGECRDSGANRATG